MKHLITICLLTILSSTPLAQTESKRPSWSQGLPERQTTHQPGSPDFIPQTATPTDQSQPKIVTEQPITPDLEIELTTQPKMEFNVKPTTIEQPETTPIRRAGYRRLQNRTVENNDTNPLHDQYNWAVLKTTPIDIPARHATKNELKVRIYINPDGQVVRVAAGAPDVPAMMLKEAQQSIQNWEFEPPKNIGITDNIAKTFTIEIKTG